MAKLLQGSTMMQLFWTRANICHYRDGYRYKYSILNEEIMYEDSVQGLYVLTQRLQCGRYQRLVWCDGDTYSFITMSDAGLNKGVTLTNGVFHCWSVSLWLSLTAPPHLPLSLLLLLCGFLVATRRRVGWWLHLSLLSCPPLRYRLQLQDYRGKRMCMAVLLGRAARI